MKFVDEYRDAERGRARAAEILAAVEPGRHYKVMEVCGGHTHTIYKYGVDDLLPENVELVHGPGCPVCVIPMGRVDDGIAVAHEPNVPPLRALLESPDLRLDGFLGPGHVATVVGARPFEFLPADYGKPLVVSGFEPLDLLQSVHMVLRQLREGRCEVENQYKRVVPYDGNPQALKVLADVFELRPHFEWRGLGFISHSGLKLSGAFADFDAELRHAVPGVRVADPKACQCGEVLKGVIKPWECKVFGTACTPEHAIGTCMVSPEGACAAYYNFGRLAREREVV